MRHRPFLVAAALWAVGATPAGADPAARLVHASEAARQTSYEGVVVFRDERTIEVLRFAHRTKDGRVQERLTSLTGTPRDVLREGDRLSCAMAGGPVQSAGGIPQSLFPVFSAETLAAAAPHYEFRELGEARVAGRACQGLAMVPRDDFRYGYEICADTATAVPLRVSLLDRAGRAVEQLMFTQVTFPDAIADAAFAPLAGPAAATRTAAPAAPEAASPWQLAQLPPGFRVVMTSRLRAADGRGVVEHLLLSDGLSAVSVFGARLAAEDHPLRGFSRVGAVNAYGRRVGAFHVTVVGEVPKRTVRMIGDGFTPEPPEDAAPRP